MYLENRPRGYLRPMRIFSECVRRNETEGTQICDRLVQLRKEDMNKKIVQERGQGAHSNFRVHRDDVFQFLDELKRWREKKTHVEHAGLNEDLVSSSRIPLP